MTEKIDEFPISQPLTSARRKKLEKMIDENAFQSPSPVSYHWEDPHLLRVVTKPVEWKIVFEAHKIEVFATAPFWAKMLLTRKRREEMHQDSWRRRLRGLGFFGEEKGESGEAEPKDREEKIGELSPSRIKARRQPPTSGRVRPGSPWRWR